MKDEKFQQLQLEKLRSGEAGCYEDASIYTVLLDLVEGNGVDTVYEMLVQVAANISVLPELKDEILKSLTFKK